MLGVAADFGQTLFGWRTWWLMSSQDIRLRYKRSTIGPFWLSVAMAVQVCGIGLLFSQIYDQPLDSFLLYISSGFLVWGLVAALIGEGCMILIEAEGNLRALPIPAPVLSARMVARNVIIFFHNLLVIGGLILFLGLRPGLEVLMFIPGVALIALFGFFCGVLLGPLCLRFRDVAQVVSSIIGVAFFLTPIIWMPSQGRVSELVVQANPLFHLTELVRAPLLGTQATELNWIVSAGVTAGVAVLSVVSLALSRRRIYFWL
ncbi:MAG: ABC transporter permease [Caulobacterales bacterium]